MFTRSFLGNQFQPLAFGASPFAGFGGITPFPAQMAQMSGYNPLVPFLTPQGNAVGTFGGYNPALQQFGNYGFNPYLAAQVTGGIPVPGAPPLAGLNPGINPLVAAQLAGVSPNLVPQIWGGAFGQHSNPGLINPLFQQIGGETSYWGQPFGNQIGQFGQLGWGNTGQGLTPFQAPVNPFGQSLTGGLPTQAPNYYQSSPYMAQDPITATLFAQQLNPLAQQKLPIRPLTGQQPIDPFQGSPFGMPTGQVADPYFALAQAQLMSQYASNPIQQLARPYTLGNWAGSPHSIGQTPPIGQAGMPFNL